MKQAYGSVAETYTNNFQEVVQFVFNHIAFVPKNDMDQAALAAEMEKKNNTIWNNPKTLAPYEFKTFQPEDVRLVGLRPGRRSSQSQNR